jgi:SnoaL-like protein
MAERTSVSRRRGAVPISPDPSAEIGALLDRYLIGLDEGGELDDAWARSVFTEPACVEFPMSRHEGLAGVAAYHNQAMAAFERTQHLNSPALVEVAGDRALLTANLISTHVHRSTGAPAQDLFMAGTRCTGEACRTAEGWRLRRLSFDVIWTSGSPPGARNG